MTEIVIPPQVRAGRALLGWSQEELAESSCAVTTVRDVEPKNDPRPPPLAMSCRR